MNDIFRNVQYVFERTRGCVCIVCVRETQKSVKNQFSQADLQQAPFFLPNRLKRNTVFDKMTYMERHVIALTAQINFLCHM